MHAFACQRPLSLSELAPDIKEKTRKPSTATTASPIPTSASKPNQLEL